MAVEKRKYKNRTTYRAYWRNPFTQKIERGPARDSLKEARKDDAEIKVKLEFDPAYFVPGDMPTPGQGFSVTQLFDMYIAKKEMAASTKEVTFHHYATIKEHIGNAYAGSLTKDDLKSLERALQQTGIKQNTIYRRISIIRAILNWAVDDGLLAENPVIGYRCKQGEDSRIPPPTPTEARAIIAHAPKHLMRAVILSYYLGIRPGQAELFSLKWEDFDADRKRVRVLSAQKNKTRPWRDIDVVDTLFELMKLWRKEDEDMGITYIINYKGQPVQSIKTAWKGCKKRSGISRRIRLYDLRHAFATETIAAGADVKAVSDIMGHSTTAMIHRHYQHVVDEQKRKVVESVPDILSGIQHRDTKQTLSGYFPYPDKMILQ